MTTTNGNFMDQVLDGTAGPVVDPTDGGGPGDGTAGVEGEKAPENKRRRRTLIVLAILAVLLLLVGAIFVWYLITRKPLSALPGLSNDTMPAYSYSIYHLDTPLGVAVSLDGERIYVTQNPLGKPVQMLSKDGKALGSLKAPKGLSKQHTLMYVAVNPTNGDVYVSDTQGKALYVYAPDGTYKSTFAPAAVKTTWEPLALAFDPNGNLYVSDVHGKAQRLLEFDTSGRLVRTLTTKNPVKDPMSFPNGIAADANGNVAVADSNNARVLLFRPDGSETPVITGGMGDGDIGMPRGMVFDDNGRLMVVDTVNQTVKVYRVGDPATSVEFVGAFGLEGQGEGQFEYPNSIAKDGHGRVFVTDRANNRVQVWTY